MSALTTLRARRAAAAQRGYASMMILILVIVVASSSLMALKAAQSSTENTIRGRAFTLARDNQGNGISDAVGALNSGALAWTTFTSGVTPSPSGRGTYQYTLDTTAQTLAVRGDVDTATQAQVFPIRARYVSFVATDADGNKAYGVTPNGTASATEAYAGLWGSAVSTSSDSTFYGRFTGATDQWDLYGGTANIESAPPNIVSYSDGSAAKQLGGTSPGTALPYLRSQFSGFIDTKQLSERVSGSMPTGGAGTGSGGLRNCAYQVVNALTPPSTATPPAPAPQPTETTSLVAGAYQCTNNGQTVVMRNSFSNGSGVTTLVVPGNLVIDANVAAGAGGQLHIYVTGNVAITNSSGSAGAPVARTLANTFIYAQGACSAATSSVVALTGSIACKSISFPDTATGQHSIGWVQPMNSVAALNVTAPKLVYFTEQPGFRDNRS